jgi:hypothetical protein
VEKRTRSKSLLIGRAPALAAASALAFACQGEIGGLHGAAGSGAPGSGQSPGGNPGSPGGSLPGAGPGSTTGGDGTSSTPDVNRVAIHRLNNAEYDNTMHDLLGTSSTPGKSFIEDEKLFGFDDIAAAFGMTDAQYEQYFDAADALAEETFADPVRRAKIVTCTAGSSADTTCTRKIVTDFGLRAWRRPLETAEVDRLVTLASDALTNGEDFNGSIKQVVKAMLSSVPFLYRVEADPDPAATDAHLVGPYEMASRLSYLFWSTMPDTDLMQAAVKGNLVDPDVLSTEVDRLLADPRSSAFVSNFAGQWLGLRDLESHQVDPTVFPNWSEQLRTSMVDEGLAYFREFLSGSRGMNDFFTADVNFVDGPLAQLYGIGGGNGSTATKVTNTTDSRRGFVGLASFLTLTSYSYRTAPTLRGKWVLENLLCQDIPPPPPNVPKLDSASADPSMLQSENVRKRLEAHRADPTCASCHKILDPIGLGLENFDAIGKYRATYANGDALDASGSLPDGTAFVGLSELTDALSKDTRLLDCAAKKMMTYALSREIVASDTTYTQKIQTQWTTDGLGLASLLKQIVLSDPFRYRRGEAP